MAILTDSFVLVMYNCTMNINQFDSEGDYFMNWTAIIYLLY